MILPHSFLFCSDFTISSLYISPWQKVLQAVSFLTFLHSLCVRKTDSHGQVSADPLPCIIKAVVVMLLIPGVGLFLWKTRGKKRKKGRDWKRQVSLFLLAPHPILPPLNLWLPSSFILLLKTIISGEGEGGYRLGLGVHCHGGKYMFSRPRSSFTLCMTQV